VGKHGLDARSDDILQGVQKDHVGRILHGNHQTVAILSDRNQMMPASDRHGDLQKYLRLYLLGIKGNGWHAELAFEKVETFVLVEIASFNEDTQKGQVSLLLPNKRRIQLIIGDETFIQQKFADLVPSGCSMGHVDRSFHNSNARRAKLPERPSRTRLVPLICLLGDRAVSRGSNGRE
jgi:hypothetical protein